MTMAIPFNLPSDEDTEENYRRLNQLLQDLVQVLQILLTPHNGGRRREESPPPSSSRPPPPFRSPPPSLPAEMPLPDLIPTGHAAVVAAAPRQQDKVLPPRRRRRQPKPPTQSQFADEKRSPTGILPSWLNFGIEMSQVQTYSNQQMCERSSTDGCESLVEKRRLQTKANSLVSLFVPGHLTGHIWTTVLILVGWKLLTRQRS